MSRKLYNVTTRVVGLIWAESDDDALAAFKRDLEGKGVTTLPDENGEKVMVSAFVSEPVAEMGWEGE